MSSQPDQVLSQVKYAPTGADEQEGILLMNPDGQMAALSLSLHSKQPKRAVISCEKGYIEIMEYPRADQMCIRDRVKHAILTAVKDAGPNACPPMVVGVGIGGTFEKCALLAKQALTRPVDEHSDIPYVCLLYTSGSGEAYLKACHD